MTKNSLFVRILGGALLMYQGFNLGKSVLADQPDNSTMFLVTAAVFVVLGAWFLIVGCKKLFKHEYEEPEMDNVEEQIEEQEEAVQENQEERE